MVSSKIKKRTLMSPRMTEKNEAKEWTRQETAQLIGSIKAQLQKHDPLPYSRRINALNWEQVRIPNKSVTKCKGHLNVIIKKIRRIRTLAEILSDVVEPIDMISEQMEDDSHIVIVSQSVDSNNDSKSPTTSCSKRQSERLFEANARKCSKEYVLQRSNSNASSLHSKDTNDSDILKDRSEKQADDENSCWIRKAEDAASEGEKIENPFTECEHLLLQKNLNFGREEEKNVPEKENNPSNLRKRKLEAIDNTNQLSSKKSRKTPVKIEYSIVEKTEKHINVTARELMDQNGNIRFENVNDQICGDCASDIEMEINDPGNGLDDYASDQLPEDLVAESTVTASVNMEAESSEIASLDLMTDPTMKTTELPRIKQEASESNSDDSFLSPSPRVFSRIITICSGFLGRFGTWMVKQE